MKIINICKSNQVNDLPNISQNFIQTLIYYVIHKKEDTMCRHVLSSIEKYSYTSKIISIYINV